MLSEIIKQKIEERFGKAVRYPKDCEALALVISQDCNERVSASTVKRLYGFVSGVEQPRRFTLDLIAQNYIEGQRPSFYMAYFSLFSENPRFFDGP